MTKRSDHSHRIVDDDRTQARLTVSATTTVDDEIALLEKILAEKRAANHNSGQLSENGREEADGGTAGKESDMCRIDGPFERRDRKSSKYRLRVVDRETGKTKTYTYDSEEEALAAIPMLRREYRRPIGVAMSKALEAYQEHLATREMCRVGGRTSRARSRQQWAGFARC